MKIAFLSVLAAFLITGCMPVFSDRTSRLVDPAVTFELVKKEPKAYVGKFVKVGGIIAATRNSGEGSQVEVVQFKLGWLDDIPDESYPSGGRFLAVTPDYLDNMVYKSGRPVAIIGEVKGEQTLPLDKIVYSYPVIAISEIHVWRAEDVYPDRNSYPNYYDPLYNPYWWYGSPYRYPVPRYRH